MDLLPRRQREALVLRYRLVTRFAAPIPKGAEFSAGMSITGYDAAGAKLWQDGPRTPPGAHALLTPRAAA
ncbi:hypothetical protein B0I32_101368 [Nonomuraea fuscirosea]|uniref:Uncharacterized protein n=1 Tax=Nonomuraea fuscirosea TaxID=1291556 RepID=A0A2T0NBG2_9ACTN|nr:hypothetical protein [Nonomuraea fuscirosea]PRX70280.1 hypothetical protein B0I32_101368 [Nonomuraea fuscirosea]